MYVEIARTPETKCNASNNRMPQFSMLNIMSRGNLGKSLIWFLYYLIKARLTTTQLTLPAASVASTAADMTALVVKMVDALVRARCVTSACRVHTVPSVGGNPLLGADVSSTKAVPTVPAVRTEVVYVIYTTGNNAWSVTMDVSVDDVSKNIQIGFNNGKERVKCTKRKI